MSQIAAKDPEKLDWFEMYPEPFFGGVEDYDFTVRGAYALVLFMVYSARGGRLPDDAAKIARKCGLSTRKWNLVRQILLKDDKLHLENGHLVNRRATAYFDAKLPKVVENRRKIGEKTRDNRGDNRGDKKNVPPQQELTLGENDENGPYARAKSQSQSQSQSQTKTKSRPSDVAAQVIAIAEALGQRSAAHWETNYCQMIDQNDLSFEDVLEAAKTHKANGREIIRSITALRALACAKRDRRMGAARSQAVDTVDVGNVTVDEWKTALVTLARAGVWNDPVFGDLPGTDDYRGPKDLEALFLEAWRKQGSHPIDELDADHHWQTYPADNPDPIRRARWSRIK